MSGISIGIKCKACDASLSSRDADTELCGVCLEVVNDINRKFYEQVDDKAFEEACNVPT